MKPPFAAFRIQAWSRAAAAVYAVTVLEVDEVSETALCREGIGSTAREFRIGFDSLATSPERLAERLAERLDPLPLSLSPLPGRAPKTALAVTTPGKGGS